jgi:glycogen debranching enzyme GlgX
MADVRRIAEGRPEPLGVTPAAGGANVAVFSAHATRIELCLFDGDDRETERIDLPERTGDVFHGFVAGIGPGARYGLRAHGPFDPRAGHRFNPAKLLLDPYATVLDRRFTLHPAMFDRAPEVAGGIVSRDDTDSAPVMPKAVVASVEPGDPKPRRGERRRGDLVYELNVRGYTKLNPNIPEGARGTLAGLAHPAAIEHLVRLGVATVELMPLAAWIDERHLFRLGLTNYWGYNPVAFLAADPRLAPGGMADVRAAVAALQAAGLEVILDVVLNHTGEGDALGPTVSLRGLDAATYYRHVDGDGARLVDDTGCGNTLALDRPPVLRLAMDALRRWAAAGFDGFRFDLGTTLGRRDRGFDPAAPLLQAIDQDPVLRTKRIVAEPWDVGPGGYRLGEMPPRWGEWNDRYRDAVRRFWRGDAGMAGELATRLAGSSDVFAVRHRPPATGVNFVAAHDGFTLADLVSYEIKHNEANGEENRDGHGGNFSWNHGVEGPTDDPDIRERRARDVRNLLLTLFASRGTPMLGMGDELGRSQHGNNNAYAQDNATAWLDWAGADHGLARFVARLAELRQAHPALSANRFLAGGPGDDTGIADVEWRSAAGSDLRGDAWAETRCLVAVLYAPAAADRPADRCLVALNTGVAATVALPDCRDGLAWTVGADTAAPDEPPGRRFVPGLGVIAVAERSAVLLVEAPAGEGREAPAGRARGVEAAVLDRLAEAAGVALDWHDLAGVRHVVGEDTKRAILAGMGLAAGSTAEARDSLARLAERRDRRPLPPVLVVRQGEPIAVPLAVSGGGRRPRTLLLQAADGALSALPVAADAPEQEVACADGRIIRQVRAAVPELPLGEHRILTEDEATACRLLVVPRISTRSVATTTPASATSQRSPSSPPSPAAPAPQCSASTRCTPCSRPTASGRARTIRATGASSIRSISISTRCRTASPSSNRQRAAGSSTIRRSGRRRRRRSRRRSRPSAAGPSTTRSSPSGPASSRRAARRCAASRSSRRSPRSTPAGRGRPGRKRCASQAPPPSPRSPPPMRTASPGTSTCSGSPTASSPRRRPQPAPRGSRRVSIVISPSAARRTGRRRGRARGASSAGSRSVRRRTPSPGTGRSGTCRRLTRIACTRRATPPSMRCSPPTCATRGRSASTTSCR